MGRLKLLTECVSKSLVHRLFVRELIWMHSNPRIRITVGPSRQIDATASQ